MTSGFMPVATLAFIAAISSLIMRRLSTRFRFSFDVACFAAISAYFESIAKIPLFSSLGERFDTNSVALRVVAGAWWLLGAHIAVDLLWFAFNRDRRSREARLLFDLSAAAIYIAAVVIMLNSVFAMPVTGVVATSGVVAIVIGLALQNTLADVFAGIAVGIEGPFRVGDRVQLGDRIEGDVVQVNWRSIRIQTDGNDVAIIPNSVVAKAEIINRSFPNERRVVSVEIPCPSRAPPDRVIELLMQAPLLCSAVLQTPRPEAAIVRIGLRQSVYRLTFHVADSRELSPTRDRLLRAARRQLRHAGLFDESQSAADLDLRPSWRAAEPRLLFQTLDLFECLTDAQIGGLAEGSTRQRLRANENLFVEGEQDRSLCIVGSGIVELARQVDGRREALGCIGAGEYVGAMELLTAAGRTATATARTDCLVYRLAQDQLKPLLADNAELAAAFDTCVRKYLESLQNNAAAAATLDMDPPDQLLERIRHLLRLRL